MASEAQARSQHSEAVPQWDVGRILHDTRTPELLCRYPNEPVAELVQIGEREVTIRHAGELVRVRVRNPEEGVPGKSYLLVRSGFDRGMYDIY